MEELTRLIQEQQDTILQLEAELRNVNGAHDISVDRFMQKSRQLEALKDDYEVDMIGLAQYILDDMFIQESQDDDTVYFVVAGTNQRLTASDVVKHYLNEG
ncbi:MAG: hypothetical protein HRT61_00250 [Ekhidna sp.]|nr:hypothetical protein [Ekhidna sp.]